MLWGTLPDAELAAAADADAKTRFRGVEWNASLDPTDAANFGWCATR